MGGLFKTSFFKIEIKFFKALSKRFGFLLDKIGVDTKKLKRLIDYKYVPLECSMKPKGKKDKKWRIIENVAI